jgi:hypothetical protein
MSAITFLAPRTPQTAAKRRLAASSVAPVTSGYERSLPPCETRFSRLGSTIRSGGDR